MARAVLVELLCKAEQKVVALIETLGPLTASVIQEGLTKKDKARIPPAELIMDGAQLTCRRCHQPLYFRDAQGNLLPACPGTAEFLDDPEEEKRREERATEKTIREGKEAKGRRDVNGADWSNAKGIKEA